MNRERKYRAYNPKTDAIIYSGELSLPVFFKALELAPDAIIDDWTGLTDKDGTEIYEGDILRIDVARKVDTELKTGRTVVTFEDGCYYTPIKTSRYRLGGWANEAISVIGNIHQHPDLLTP